MLEAAAREGLVLPGLRAVVMASRHDLAARPAAGWATDAPPRDDRTEEVTEVDVPDGLRYSEEHEWLRLEGDEGVVGITAYAAGELGDIVFVELPRVGRRLERNEAFGVIESVKTASDLFAPVVGEVVAVNEALASAPELVNEEPYGGGWLIRLHVADAAEVDGLMDAAAYRAHTGA
jgi:glycine cleavage system H protein